MSLSTGKIAQNRGYLPKAIGKIMPCKGQNTYNSWKKMQISLRVICAFTSRR